MSESALELERELLGVMIWDSVVAPQVFDNVSVDDFQVETYRRIFATAKKLHVENQAVDVINLQMRLKMNDESGSDISGSFLVGLISDVVTSAHITSLINGLLEQSQVRKVRKAIADTTLMLDNKENIEDIIEAHQKEISNILHRKSTDTVALTGFVGDLSKPVEGIKTGFASLDEFMTFENGNLIIVAGRPSMGKTALALSMAVNMGRNNIPVLFFSLEMIARDVVHRIASQTESVPLENIRFNKLTQEQRNKVDGENANYPNLPIYINDNSGWTTTAIRAEIRRQLAIRNIRVVFIDYMGLIKGTGESRYEEVTRISNELKSIAKSVGLPLVVLHQLNRATEGRTDKRPSLGDLRDSGAIEQDADIVLFPFREGVYVKGGDMTKAEIIVAKHRQGMTKSVDALWRGDYAEFVPVETRYEEIRRD